MSRAVSRAAAAAGLLLAGCTLMLPTGRPPMPPAFELREDERLLVVSPHPDDEVIGCGGLIRRVRLQGGRVDVVYVTQGDGYVEGVAFETRQAHPRSETFVEYGEWRRRESLGVLTLLRLPENAAHSLGFPDGGLRALWEGTRIGPDGVYRSPTTAAERVPYAEADDPGTPYTAQHLVEALVGVLDETRPTLVAIPDPRDQHGDHSAASLFALAALREAEKRGQEPRPRVITYLVHWPGWPDYSAEPPPPLRPPADLTPAPIGWRSFELSPTESADKLLVLHVYKTQTDIMGAFLDRFYRRNELFGEFTDGEFPDPETLAPLAYRRPLPSPPVAPRPPPPSR